MVTKDEPDRPELSADAARRIEAEVRLILALVNKEGEQKKSGISKILDVLSNGFIILVVGSLISLVLVPHFQQKVEDRKQQRDLQSQALSQFMLFSNSIWREYYYILPFTQKSRITQEEYDKYLGDMAAIKIQRYDALAKLRASMLAFPQPSKPSEPNVTKMVENYAVALNDLSTQIDAWMTKMYCAPYHGASPCAEYDKSFSPYNEFRLLKSRITEFANAGGDIVAATMTKQLGQ